MLSNRQFDAGASLEAAAPNAETGDLARAEAPYRDVLRTHLRNPALRI